MKEYIMEHFLELQTSAHHQEPSQTWIIAEGETK
jgi:hypothetical protein